MKVRIANDLNNTAPYREFDILPRISIIVMNKEIAVGFGWGYWGIVLDFRK